MGTPLLPDLDTLISRHIPYITCVCFMGEGRNPTELEQALRIIRNHG